MEVVAAIVVNHAYCMCVYGSTALFYWKATLKVSETIN